MTIRHHRGALCGAVLTALLLTACAEPADQSAPPLTEPKAAAPSARESAPAESAPPETAPAETAPAARAPASEAVPAPEAEVAIASVPEFLTIEQPETLRLYLVDRSMREPEAAVFYGYIAIGFQAAPERKAAVMRGLACRLEAVASAEAAEALPDLALFTAPVTEGLDAAVVSPGQLGAAYDFPRARLWLDAAGSVSPERFSDSAILFIGSAAPRLADLDLGDLTQTPGAADPIIADASDLSARYLERWSFEMVQAVKSGAIRDRVGMQSVMEAHSWIEVVGEPLAAFFKLAPSAQADTLSELTCQ